MTMIMPASEARALSCRRVRQEAGCLSGVAAALDSERYGPGPTLSRKLAVGLP
jgi:hypothetical protein